MPATVGVMITWLRNILSNTTTAEEWQRVWDARVEALQGILGECDGTVYHTPAPMHHEGYADVLRFRHHVDGVTYVTCDLIGNRRQAPNNWGNYELMICTREDCVWAPAMLSRLAKYTHDAAVHVGDTMDLGGPIAPGSSISALLFTLPDPQKPTFDVLGKPASIMLCLGITAEEFVVCKDHNSKIILRMLKEHGHSPYTDLQRKSMTVA